MRQVHPAIFTESVRELGDLCTFGTDFIGNHAVGHRDGNCEGESMRTQPALKQLFTSAALPLFLGAALSDCAYKSSYEIQWMNFSSWLIIGALVFATLAIFATLAAGLQHSAVGGRRWISLFVLLAVWILGVVNAFVHARDAWAMMPTGWVLSLVCAVLACIATWSVYCNDRSGGAA